MAISPITKDKVMRPSLIDSVDKINEIIVAVNLLDPAEIDAIESRLDSLETSVTGISTRIDNISTQLATMQQTLTTQQQDITQIKTTLYTPLSSGGA